MPLPSVYSGEESSFKGSASPDVIVHSASVVNIKPGDYGVVIGYHMDEFFVPGQ